MGGFGDSTCNYSVAIRVNRVMLVSLWTEPVKLVEGNASVYQMKPVSRITGEGRVGVGVWGEGVGGEIAAAGYPVRRSVYYSGGFRCRAFGREREKKKRRGRGEVLKKRLR